MSTDRELLKLAANVAGISKQWDGSFVDKNHPEHVWNPLTDDGDALRLVVRLKISVFLGEAGYVTAGRHDIGGHRVPIFDDDDAATRRAIVRAAAAIGGAI